VVAPVCVGKSLYAASTVQFRRKSAMIGDEKRFRDVQMKFFCAECDVQKTVDA